MTNVVQVGASDVIGQMDYGSQVADFLDARSAKFFETSSALLKCFDTESGWNSKFAGHLDTAHSVLSVVWIVGDGISLVADVQKCREVVRTRGFCSLANLDASRKLLRSVCSLTSDGSSVLGLLESSGVPLAITAEMAPFMPVCDAYVYASDMWDNAEVLFCDKGSASTVLEVKTLHGKYWWQNLWELNRNAVYCGLAITTLCGVIFPPLGLFAVLLTGFVLSMIAFFAKQSVRDYSVTQGLTYIYS